MNESMQKDDTYGAWVERMAAGREAKPLNTDKETVVSLEGAKPFSTMEFLRLDRPHYVGEVGKRHSDYIFHFFPKDSYLINEDLQHQFEEKMGDIFLAVFDNPNQVQAVWTSELKSWAVKVFGFANTVWGDERALSVFDKLDKAL